MQSPSHLGKLFRMSCRGLFLFCGVLALSVPLAYQNSITARTTIIRVLGATFLDSISSFSGLSGIFSLAADVSDEDVFQSVLDEPSAPSSAKYAIFTMVTNPRYMASIQTLGYSIQKWIKPDTDMIAMTMNEGELTEVEYRGLKAAKFKIFRVPHMKPPRPPAAQFHDQFTKLWMWNQTQYECIMYMDGDMVSLKPMDDLLRSLKADFAASRDFGLLGGGARFWETFSAGFMVLRPTAKEFEYFMKLIRENTVNYRADQAEQGFLNELKKDTWFELSFVNNVVTSTYWSDRGLWNSLKPFIRGLHLTETKPFLINFADYDHKEEAHAIAYSYWKEMFQKWEPYSYTFVTAVFCEGEKQRKYDFAPPIVVIHLCTEANKTDRTWWRRNEKSKVLHIRLKDKNDCNLDSIKWPADGKDRARTVEAYARDNCAAQLLERVSGGNPFLTHFTYWIDIQTIENANAIPDIIEKLNVASKAENYNLGSFLAVAVPNDDATVSVTKSDCDRIRAFGGSKFAMQKFRQFRDEAGGCQGTAPQVAKHLVLKDATLSSRTLNGTDIMVANVKNPPGPYCNSQKKC